MKQVVLNVKTHSALGSSAVKRLRDAGQIPAVIYGESGVSHLEIDAVAFGNAWRSIGGRASLVELHADGDKEGTFAIIKGTQRHSTKDNFLHVDFLEIVRGKDMEAAIPVITQGIAYGVKNEQGVVEINAHEVPVRCRPKSLPEAIVVDVTDLKVGDSVHLGQLAAIDGVTFMEDEELVLVSCVASSGGKSGLTDEEIAEAEEAEAAAAAETAETAEAETPATT